MLRSAVELAPSVAERADVIIVGGGAIGLSIATALARAGKTVAVIEAGGRTVQRASQSIFEAASWCGYPLEGLHRGRVRALGGTTNLWAGQLAVLEPIVLEERSWVADVGWPISARELDDAYDMALDLVGLSASLRDEDIWGRLGIDPPATGADLEFFFTRWTPETNFTRLFEEEIHSQPGLRVFLDALVTGLALSDDSATITGIRARMPDGTTRCFAASDIVLANGTIEIARLLSLPLADGRRGPWSDNRWLGSGFVDHIDAYAGPVTLIDRKRFHALFDSAFIGGLKYKPKLKLSALTQRRDALVGASADFVFDTDFRDELAVLKGIARGFLNGRIEGRLLRALASDPQRMARLLQMAVPAATRYLHHRRTYNPGDRGIRLRLSTEQKPLPASRLRLLDAVDETGMPTIEVEWQIDGEEVEAMATVSLAVSDFLERHRIARVDLDERLRTRSRDFLASIDDANHHMGMVRMAHGPDAGVVDRNLKVFGTNNLYVAGAATFPTTGFANPTFTAIALGLRLAKMLSEGPRP